MDRLFFDTSVILDVLEQRAPWFPDALECMSLVRSGQCVGAMTALSLSDIAYIQRGTPVSKIYRAFEQLAKFLQIAPLDQSSVPLALSRQMADIEDGFQFQAALAWKASHFLTRNTSDFTKCEDLVLITPTDYAANP
jgi:hypothetical protein